MPRRSTDEAVKIEDLLREEYFDLLPEIRRVLWQLDTEIRYLTLPILQTLRSHEQLVVKSRVKECESAIRTLRANQDPPFFVPERINEYTMLNLPDLAGVRVLVFPNNRLAEVDNALRPHFQHWTSKPVRDDEGNSPAPKYFGYCEQVSRRIRAEYQIRSHASRPILGGRALRDVQVRTGRQLPKHAKTPLRSRKCPIALRRRHCQPAAGRLATIVNTH